MRAGAMPIPPFLAPVLGTALRTAIDAQAVQATADDVVARRGVANRVPPWTKHDRVLLEGGVVSPMYAVTSLPLESRTCGRLAGNRVGLLGVMVR